ncbi:MAG: YceI family protein [Chloroflexi bacterium]|nr:YceI family protein [Chloroflexota bacterium]MCI0576410.1 YceI family protein [Chloroflexota bacterium]MCI0644282.1 YceI family protein [Chloroflexota bacterium]MCI0726265.1 YceI family protein [Chloroflexota bacterium]
MKKQIWTLLGLLILASLAAGCALLQAPEVASGPLEAIPVQIATPAATTATAPETATETDGGPADAVENTSAVQVYQINQAGSQVRFELDEDLRSQRQTVVGTGTQIAGEIALNLDDLSTTQVGVIQINARSLATDNNMRNRAINNWILETNQYELITFTPTAVEGLPTSATVGQEVTFTIAGDLTIRDVTQPVVFTVVATATSDAQLTGTASAVVNRGDFGLTIPSVPNVANVEETVELTIDFVANAV